MKENADGLAKEKWQEPAFRNAGWWL